MFTSMLIANGAFYGLFIWGTSSEILPTNRFAFQDGSFPWEKVISLVFNSVLCQDDIEVGYRII